jgi:simple sugar transport system ATP-binding protein
VLVMSRGRISGELPIDACTEGALGRLMGDAGHAQTQEVR